MQTVAVALIDALGFKGIWKAVEPAEVLKTLRGFRLVAHELTGALCQTTSPVAFHAQSISDSLVFAAAASDAAHAPRLLDLLGVAVARFIRNALLSDVPLVFRGCMTVGEGILEDGLIVGESIDCAAAHFERADVACVWLHPDAIPHIESIKAESRSAYWFTCEVPFKDSPPERTFALNPFGFTYSSTEHLKLKAQMQAAFARRAPGVTVNLEQKLLNTSRFFADAAEASARWWVDRGLPLAYAQSVD
jgi:hypothetical protein